MSHYAVIDTNVLISALLSKHDDSATVQVIERVLEGIIIPIYSDSILNEYKKVLKYQKFNFTTDLIDYLIDVIEKHGVRLNPSPLNCVLQDMADLPFYELIVEVKDDDTYLVTGNSKHFPTESHIVTPRKLIEILDSINKTN